MIRETKFRVGNYRYPVRIEEDNGRAYFHFSYNKGLIAEIKNLEGRKYHGFDEKNPRKLWSAPLTCRNRFQLQYLESNTKEESPYYRYDKPLEFPDIPDSRYNAAKRQECKLFKHQPHMIAHMLTRRYCIVAGEMGTSKTLSAIIAIEKAQEKHFAKYGKPFEFWYVAPKSALRAVQREFIIWQAKHRPTYWLTYEAMTRKIKEWKSGEKAPTMVIFDESSKLKTPTSQRTQAAQALADGIRSDWGDDGYVILMSGTPAPKSPADWWSQAEIACPGFLKEGNIHLFKERLAVIIQREKEDGSSFPQIVTWRDSEEKCNKCGRLAKDPCHDMLVASPSEYHLFEPCKNEVQILYQRLKGLVEVYFKKDCIDLPDKNYRKIILKPTQATLRAAKMIPKVAKSAAVGLILLRELSDGFQYQDRPTGRFKTCPDCAGKGTVKGYKENEANAAEPIEYDTPCGTCKGKGEVEVFERVAVEVTTPKDGALVDLLDEYEDVGRVVIFGGFTGTIDRITRTCIKQGWYVIQVREGNWKAFDDSGRLIPNVDFLGMFQDELDKYPRVAFVAHPGSGGMGLTLTASPVAIFYSNDFNGENRMQAEDRIHRSGMDANRGATIIDLIHLPSDQKILENLQKKRDLQAMSLGELQTALEQEISDDL